MFYLLSVNNYWISGIGWHKKTTATDYIAKFDVYVRFSWVESPE